MDDLCARLEQLRARWRRRARFWARHPSLPSPGPSEALEQALGELAAVLEDTPASHKRGVAVVLRTYRRVAVVELQPGYEAVKLQRVPRVWPSATVLRVAQVWECRETYASRPAIEAQASELAHNINCLE